MKKILLIIIFLLILIAIPLTVFLVRQRQEVRQKAAPASVMYIDPSTITKNVDDTFDVDVKIDTAENRIFGAEILVTFNTTYLEALNIRQGTFLPSVLTAGTVDNQNGTASIVVGQAESPGGGAQGQGQTIAIVTFKAKASTDGTPTNINLPLDITPPIDSPTNIASSNEPGSDNTNVLISTTPGQVTINTAGSSPAPSATPDASGSPLPTPTPSPGGPTPTPSPTPSGSPEATTRITAPTGSTSQKRPAMTGYSFANGLVILSVTNSSNAVVITQTLNADAQGNWTYTPTTDLTVGTYTITVTGENNSTGATESATGTFTITDSGSGGTDVASPTPSPSSSPVAGCNVSCSSSIGCTTGVYSCYIASGETTGYCRNPQCQTNSDCTCGSGPGPTPSPSTSGGTVPTSGVTTPTIMILGFAFLLLIFGAGAIFFIH